MTGYPARYWHRLKDGRLQCDLCPRACKLKDGKRGLCFVRQAQGGQMILTTYGRSSGFCIDPIEKKPLNHFYPGTPVLSFGTAGCNLACKFCQNHDISMAKEFDRLCDQASAQDIANAAKQQGCHSVALTYNEPVIFLEYGLDVADACHEQGIEVVAVTSGYVNQEAGREFYQAMDAANVDLKAFNEGFYKRLTGGDLKTVLKTLAFLREHTKVWFEITTLVIEGENDSDQELTALCRWVKANLGAFTPIHFSAFHPAHKMLHHPPTSKATLIRARNIALGEGLLFAYTGNVIHVEGDTTYCPGCQRPVIERQWYELISYQLDAAGHCNFCQTQIAGRFAAKPGDWGAKRKPVRLGY